MSEDRSLNQEFLDLDIFHSKPTYTKPLHPTFWSVIYRRKLESLGNIGKQNDNKILIYSRNPKSKYKEKSHTQDNKRVENGNTTLSLW